MPSAFVQIADAVVALLQQAPAVAERVQRGFAAPAPRERATHVNVRIAATQAQVASVASGPKDWTTTVVVECMARHAPDVAPETAVDAILQAAYERLVSQGAGLGIGVEDIAAEPAVTWDADEGDTPLAIATMSVQLIHRTEALTLAPRN